MKIGLSILSIILLSLSFLVGCDNSEQPPFTEEQPLEIGELKRHRVGRTNAEAIVVFKAWLTDTLPVLTNWQSLKDTNVVRKIIEVDSVNNTLGIQVDYKAQIKLSNLEVKNTYAQDVINVIEWLRDYNEMPKNDFELTFSTYISYAPSFVEQLGADYVYEWKNIRVLDKAVEFWYGYIRGHLSHKTVITASKGQLDTIHIEFHYPNGDSLAKDTFK